MSTDDDDITRLLEAWGEGDPDALEELLELVYGELHNLARHQFVAESDDHTLQPTAVVNELFIRLMDQRQRGWRDRLHFFGSMSKLIRRILVDHARKRHTRKRGRGVHKIPLRETLDLAAAPFIDPVELLALDEALEKLEKLEGRHARIIEMKFFLGLGADDIAEAEGISRAQVYRDLSMAELFLKRALTTTGPNESEGP